jgi:hypothetical protein
MRRTLISKPDTGTDDTHLDGTSAFERPSASDAKNAINDQKASPLAHYTRDLAEVLSSLAECFDFDDKGQAEWKVRLLPRVKSRDATKREKTAEVVEEWDGTLSQINDALERRNVEAIGWYLSDAADVLRILAALLDPPQGSKHWRLEFKRTGRGRPRDHVMSRSIKEAERRDALSAATRKAQGKQEAGIALLKGKPGLGRSALIQAKKFKRPRKSEK